MTWRPGGPQDAALPGRHASAPSTSPWLPVACDSRRKEQCDPGHRQDPHPPCARRLRWRGPFLVDDRRCCRCEPGVPLGCAPSRGVRTTWQTISRKEPPIYDYFSYANGVRQAHELSRSALPDAPVVDDRDSANASRSPHWASALRARLGLGRRKRRLGDRCRKGDPVPPAGRERGAA